ncbi:MAG: hypothetical protein ABIH69_00360 [bacterium]
MKVSKREKNLLIISSGFIIFYFFYNFLLTPKLDEYSNVKNKITSDSVELRLLEQKIKVLDQIEKAVKLKNEKRSSLLSDVERSLYILRVLAKSTSQSGLKLIRIKPVQNDKKGDDGVKFELDCRGSYQEFYDFLDILNGLDVVVIIDSMGVVGGGSESPVLVVKFAITAYY